MLEVGNLYKTNAMIFGREEDDLFVNSAHYISADSVEEVFPKARFNGSVRLTDVFEEARQSDELLQIADLVVGRVAIRKTIESLGKEYRGTPYTKRQANNIVKRADYVRTIERDGGVSIPWTCVSSLSNHVEKNYQEGQSEHRKALETVRARRLAGKEKTHK